MEKIDLGKIIKQARIGKNISQKELAREMGVKPGAVSSWETNKTSPPAHTLIAIAKKLEIIDQIFGRKTSEQKSELQRMWKVICRIENKIDKINKNENI